MEPDDPQRREWEEFQEWQRQRRAVAPDAQEDEVGEDEESAGRPWWHWALALTLVIVVGGLAVLAGGRWLNSQVADINNQINVAAGGSPSPAPVDTVSAACATELMPVLVALEDLDARLNVGLTKVQYGEKVGDVSVAYNRLTADELLALGPACLTAGGHLEDAFNEYIAANNAWSDCFSDTDCSNDSVRPTLQRHWSEATRKIAEARRLFP